MREINRVPTRKLDQPGYPPKLDVAGNLPVNSIQAGLIAEDNTQATPGIGVLSAVVDDVESPTRLVRFTGGDGLTSQGVPLSLNSPNVINVTAEHGEEAANIGNSGMKLLAAYARAKAMTHPGGSERGSANQVYIVVWPGTYMVSYVGPTSLEMDTDYVNVIGFGPDVTHIMGVEEVVKITASRALLQGVSVTAQWAPAIAVSPNQSSHILRNLKLKQEVYAGPQYPAIKRLGSTYGNMAGLYEDIDCGGHPVFNDSGITGLLRRVTNTGDTSFTTVESGGRLEHCSCNATGFEMNGGEAHFCNSAGSGSFKVTGDCLISYCRGGQGSFEVDFGNPHILYCIKNNQPFNYPEPA